MFFQRGFSLVSISHLWVLSSWDNLLKLNRSTLEGHPDDSQRGYSLHYSWFTSAWPLFLGQNPFESQLKTEMVYQDHYPWWNPKPYFSSPISERLPRVYLNLTAAYLMSTNAPEHMDSGTNTFPRTPGSPRWSFILCPPTAVWVRTKSSVPGIGKSCFENKSYL